MAPRGYERLHLSAEILDEILGTNGVRPPLATDALNEGIDLLQSRKDKGRDGGVDFSSVRSSLQLGRICSSVDTWSGRRSLSNADERRLGALMLRIEDAKHKLDSVERHKNDMPTHRERNRSRQQPPSKVEILIEALKNLRSHIDEVERTSVFDGYGLVAAYR